ncbi:threonine/homoserine exporter RhtA [Tatumella sp. TA1]|uniref:threonine/homoserine exporter RhtA n=1 Tax=Rosenbergiella collisarenosi TaxID=1544695 RepID=UPI0008F85D5C|nr:threonine/homoserine exporter RhtA [Rosenbergiella collisarenosi]MBT0722101.1 threonine/homoserine exporter RhtA [Rosenbergiella collisarenosi]QGX91021.1 threonine/homoserine exporter RhtA [Tatumella sp. TA1]
MGNLTKRPASVLYPIGLLLIAMFTLQGAASLAKSLFSEVGAPGVAALRLGLSTLMLWAMFKPWRLTFTAEQRRPLVFYGLALGGMNFLFYMALRTIPLGIGVALEFVGPLTLALANSRKLTDFLWIIIAVSGLWLLLPLHGGANNIDPLGAFFALAAGACWAIYIIFGQKAGAEHGAATVAVGSLIASLVFVPTGLVMAEPGIWHWSILPIGLLVALLSNAIPYSLEMMALTRVPARVFGTLMSMEPAVAALSGFLFLSEHLSLIQLLGLFAIILASAGSALTMQSKESKIKRIKIKKKNNSH